MIAAAPAVTATHFNRVTVGHSDPLLLVNVYALPDVVMTAYTNHNILTQGE
jgi:hypothetical protein